MLSESSAAMRGSEPAREDTRPYTRSRNGKGVRPCGRTPFQIASVLLTPGRFTFAALRLDCGHFRRRVAYFNLGAHSLDFSSLLFKLGCRDFHSLRLLRDR